MQNRTAPTKRITRWKSNERRSVRATHRKKLMMNHTNGWMGWAGGGMWIWTVIGVLVVVLLVVVINKLSKK